MELEYRKQIKDATSLLLMMDHDSGYVEGGETCTSSSNESGPLKELGQTQYKQPENIFLSEDALLEKPDICFNLSANLPYEIDPKDYEESRKLFFSPEFISPSVPSQSSTMVYSGLENDTGSEASAELAIQPSIQVVDNEDMESNDNDVLMIRASESDMSLEQTFDTVIIERASICPNSITSPFKGFPRKSSESAISSTPNVNDTNNSQSLAMTKEQSCPTVHDHTINAVETPEKKAIKPVNPNISPDMFDDEMIDNRTNYFQVQSQDRSVSQTQTAEKYVDKLDRRLLKRTQKGMSGVPPPPSVTDINMSVNDILSKFELNKKSYCLWDSADDGVLENLERDNLHTSLNSSGSESANFSKSLLLSVDLEEARNKKWPEVWSMRCHGLHYNCGKISEEIVDLCDKYQKRFVGAETQSTCTVFETQSLGSPSKRKMLKPKWGRKSPGRRLSHLARRRITFSSASLQASGSSLAGSRARQILVDAKKIDLLNRRKSPRKSPLKSARRTPKKTPSKSPKTKTRTPSSSAKKKLAMRFRKLTGEFESSRPSGSQTSSSSVNRALFKSPDRGTKSENSNNKYLTKRALFQSPSSRDSNNSSLFSSKSQDSYGSEERSQLRRALFTSPKKMSPAKAKKSPFKQFGFEKKRKRSESDENHPSKFQRSMSMMDTRPSSSCNIINKSNMPRTQSELNVSSLNRTSQQNELSEQHKKKLLWAVSGALQSQNVTNTHPQWKVFASVLARVTRRFHTNQMAVSNASGAKLEGGTSERMHRIARYHVISVIKGKSADEIVNEYVRSRGVRAQRPQGYVAPEDYIKAPSGGKENAAVFTDRANTIESWEKRRLEQMSKQPTTDSKIERIRKVINFGDDR